MADQLVPTYPQLPIRGDVTSEQLKYALDYLFSVWTLTSGWTVSDGTNAFTVNNIEGWYRRINSKQVELHLGGSITTGGTVTGALLQISNSAWNLIFDSSGTKVGNVGGTIVVNSGSDPRALVTQTVVDGTTIKWTRSNTGAWATATTYMFTTKGVFPTIQ
jgi:hypothetical protein